MAEKITIRDFVIALGFEGKEAKDGLKEMEKAVKGFSKALYNSFGSHTKQLGKMVGAHKRSTSELEKQVVLYQKIKDIAGGIPTLPTPKPPDPSKPKPSKDEVERMRDVGLRRARLSLMRQRNAAIRAGTEFDAEGVAGTLASGDVKRIREAKLALEELNVAQRETIALARVRNSLTREEERAMNRQTAMDNKRVSVMRQITRLQKLGGKDTEGLEERVMGAVNPAEAEKILNIAKKQVAERERLVQHENAIADVIKTTTKAMKEQEDISKRQTKFEQQRSRAFNTRRGEASAIKDRFTSPTGKFLGGTKETSDKLRSDLAAVTSVTRKMRSAKDPETLEKLQTEYVRLKKQLDGSARAAKRAQKQFDFLRFTQKSLRESTQNLARSYVSAFAVIGGGAMTLSMGQELMATNAGMLMVSGSTEQAAMNMEYVAELASKFGTNITESAKAFSRIQTGAESAGLSMEQTKNIFESALEASTVFQLSQDETTGVLRAFQQILSYPLAPSYREVC